MICQTIASRAKKTLNLFEYLPVVNQCVFSKYIIYIEICCVTITASDKAVCFALYKEYFNGMRAFALLLHDNVH